MKQSKIFVSASAALFTAFLIGSHAAAQDDSSSEEETSSFLEEVFVTGTARTDQTALTTSYGVTVLSAEGISRDAPVGLTDLADAIPGLQGEFANGEVNSNLNVRGTQGGFVSFVSLQEDGLPVQYSPFFAEFELRHDLTYERIEAVLGGPSGIFTAQGSAATINFISRQPTESEGEARVSVTDYGTAKGELFYGGPINDNGWYGTFGGWYRQGTGVRDTGYTSERGGQIRASVRKEFAGGQFSIAYKKIDDQTPYYNPLPTDTTDSNSPKELRGYDARSDALQGPDVRVLNSKRPDGIFTHNLAEGNVGKTDQLTLSVDYDFGNGWSLSEKARFSTMQTIARDFRGASDTATLLDADVFLANQLGTLTGAFPTTESVRLVRVNDQEVIANPASLNGNGLLAFHESINYDRLTDFFVNDFRLNWEIDLAVLTIGLQSWDLSTISGNIQDQFLIDIRPNAYRYDVEALDSSGNVVGHLTDDGVLTYGTLDNHGGLDTTSNNLYVNVEFSLTDSIGIDLGARRERGEMLAFGEDVSFGVPIPDALNDPLVLADDARSITRNGNIHTGSVDFTTDSVTIGGNWAVADNVAVYARWARAQEMAFQNEFTFFSIPSFGAPPGSNLGLTDEPTELEFGEIGVRYLGDIVSGFVTYFDTTHKKSGNVTVTEQGVNIFIPVDTIATGIEFWADVEVTDNLQLSFSGVVMDSEQEGAGNVAATPVPRLPETQLRFSPVWYLADNTQIFANIQHFGMRYADKGSIELPAYTQVDVGATYNVTDALSLTLLAQNLTDEFGFTSGNFRGPVLQSTRRYNSTIPGRTFSLIATTSF